MENAWRPIEVTAEDELGVIVIERVNVDMARDNLKTIEAEWKSRGMKILKVDFSPIGKGFTKVEPYEVANSGAAGGIEPEKEKKTFCSTPQKETPPILNYRATLAKTPRKPLRRPGLLSHSEHEKIRRRNEDSGIRSFGNGTSIGAPFTEEKSAHVSERMWENDDTFKSEESSCECGTQTIGESKTERLTR